MITLKNFVKVGEFGRGMNAKLAYRNSENFHSIVEAWY